MEMTIKYFGMLAEVTAKHEEQFSSSAMTIAELLDDIYNKYPELLHKNFQVALNQRLVAHTTTLSAGEIALLPPFAGG